MEPVFRLDTINELLQKMAQRLDMKDPSIEKDTMGNMVATSGSRMLIVTAEVGFVRFIDEGYDETFLADGPASLAGAMEMFRKHVDSK